MRIVLALVAVMAVGACKKKREEAAPATPPPPAPVAPTAPSLPPLRPAQPGPVYVTLANGDLVRFDHEGWKVLGRPRENAALGLALGPDGTLWSHTGSDVYRLDGDKLVHTAAPGDVLLAAGGSDGSLWATFEGSLQHLVGDEWTVEEVPGGDPARSIAPAPEGVWVATLDRTYRKDGAAWTAFDVPGVTGGTVDIYGIASNGRGGVYLATEEDVFAFDGHLWKRVSMPKLESMTYAWVAPGPEGRFAYGTSSYERFYGDTVGGIYTLDASAVGIETHRLTPRVVDDRGRTWADDGAGIVVFDIAGNVVRRWRAEEVPAFTSRPVDIAVQLGGPAQLQSGERATATITGKVEGSAAGLKLVACAQVQPEYRKAPCEGIATARSTTTVAGGRFTLQGVLLGPTNFWVQRGERWRSMRSKDCCAQVPPDGTFEVGTLAYGQ